MSTEKSARERRRTPRLDVNGRIEGYLMSLNMSVTVNDIGLGGFSLETDEPLPPGLHVVKFTAEDRWSISLCARSRYSRITSAMNMTPRYITGFEYFAEESPETQQTIEILVARLTAVLAAG